MKKSVRQKHGQMSESFWTAAFLSVSGGLQDAYTYLFRGRVFANAQTGNIVLLSQSIIEHNFSLFLHYLIPLISFAVGIAASELIRQRYLTSRRIHWRQLVLLSEIALLFLVGFFPEKWNLSANAIVSFSCAMQVQAFRKVNGYAFSSTMCIGNIRSCTEALCAYLRTRSRQTLCKSFCYLSIIILFAVGAGLGGYFLRFLSGHTIWISCFFLFFSFLLMFLQEKQSCTEA